MACIFYNKPCVFLEHVQGIFDDVMKFGKQTYKCMFLYYVFEHYLFDVLAN